MLPNFLIIGAQRCATTWLHRCLSEHPQVFMCSEKEAHFFDARWDRGLAWYKGLFKDCEGAVAVGEATPEYMWKPVAVKRMASTLPNAKLIAVVRNPIDRAYSAYWLRRRIYQGMSFEEAVEADPNLLRRGHYAQQLKRVLRYYPREQLLVLLFDDLKHDDEAFVQRTFQFLEVDPDYRPSLLGHTYNAVLFPRIRGLLDQLSLTWAIDVIKTIRFDLLIRHWSRASDKRAYPKMKQETRNCLQSYFAESNAELEEIIGVEVDWR